MKTLYININNEQIQSNEDLEVLPHRLDIDLLYYLGEEIADGCRIKDETRLVTDFRTSGDGTEYKKIAEQLDELKEILFSSEYDGKYEFRLPQGYIDWLNYHPEYNSVYNKNFSHDGSNVISVDLEDLYENSVENLQRKILNKLRVDDFYKEVDEIVFNDDVVTRKSSIVCTIKDKYEGVGFKAYKKWLQDNKEKTSDVLDLSEKCKEEPCESESPEDFLFPIDGITLGRTLISEVNNSDIEEHQFAVSYKTDNGIVFYGYENVNNRFVYAVLESKYSMPMKWKKQIGLDFGYKYEKCIKILLNKGYKIKIKDDFGILLITPNKLYFITLEFDFRKKLDGVNVILNKCPYCNSSNFDFLDLDTAPTCKKCGKAYDEVEKNGIIDKKETNIEDPICPNCSSDDVDDDGSDYLQYTCNDCGHNWGHDDTVECPECGSDDVENDGTDYLQYTCNDCGHNWGDDEDEDDFDDDEEENFSHPLSLNDFFPVCGITLNKSTVKDAERQSYRYAEIEYCDGGCVIAWANNSELGGKGAQIRKEANSNLFTNIYITSSDIMFPEWSRLGFDFKLSYNDWISLFKKMRFTIIQTVEPQIKSWEHGPDYFYTKIVAISKDYSLKFELVFSYGSDGNTRYSRSTLYSISVYSKDYSSDYGGHIGKKTFYNIEDFLRKEPKKYL